MCTRSSAEPFDTVRVAHARFVRRCFPMLPLRCRSDDTVPKDLRGDVPGFSDTVEDAEFMARTCRLRFGHGSALAKHVDPRASLAPDSEQGRQYTVNDLPQLLYHRLIGVQAPQPPPPAAGAGAGGSPDGRATQQRVPYLIAENPFVPVEVCQSSNLYLLPPKVCPVPRWLCCNNLAWLCEK